MDLCSKCGLRPKQQLKNRLDTFCKECRSAYGKEHYRSNVRSYNERRYFRQVAYRRKLREHCDAEKSKPCMDCGEVYIPSAMEFDHRPGSEKSFNVSEAFTQGISLERLKEEIAKCDVVCVLCHRYRTAGVSRFRNVAQSG